MRPAFLWWLLIPAFAMAQDARELAAENAKAGSGVHPLVALMHTQHSKLKPDLRGVHPRVYFTKGELEALRARARTTHKAIWARALKNVRALKVDPPPAPAQERRAQNEVGLGMAEAAFAYRIDGNPKYLKAARKYLEAATSYEIWGYANNKPDVDLAAGHLLYGMGWTYDLLYGDLTPAERTRYRDKLTKQARKVYEYFKPSPGKTYAYSQNHTYIPIAGLGVAAYVLYDEVPDAPQWAALSRAIFDRTLATFSTDGYFYEGFEYWVFSMPWIVHWLDAHAHATGEYLFDHPGLRDSARYVAHSMLPGAQYVFDFGDVWEGPETRAGLGKDYARSHPGGNFGSNYNLLYRFASQFRDPGAQGLALSLDRAGHVSAEEAWSLAWYDDKLAATPLDLQPRWHYFADHEVVYWRSDWSPNATAFAFKCGAPEGHHTAKLLEAFKDWRLSSGHAHPDAASFIVYAGGAYLTGDSGYAGIPLAAHHNTVLVNGRGQGNEGEGHDAWQDFPYASLDRLRLSEIQATVSGFSARCDATGAYPAALKLEKFERTLAYSAGSGFVVTDELRAGKASTFTALIHADDQLQARPPGWRIESSGSLLDIEVAEPGDATTTIEPNELITAGPPGAVDKGERTVRGMRLSISTPPAKEARIVVKLKPVAP